MSLRCPLAPEAKLAQARAGIHAIDEWERHGDRRASLTHRQRRGQVDVVSWLIVVGVLIVVAIALHFGEKAKERASRAKQRVGLAAEPVHQISFEREVHERWSADLRAMTLQVSRAEAGAAWGPADSFALERDPAGAWTITGTASAPALPARIAEQLEARFQRVPAQAES